MSFNDLTSGVLAPREFNVVIEIPANSDPVKYEVDKESGTLRVDRFINVSMRYPMDYGYIPGTFSDDGDPLDVLVMCPAKLVHGCVLLCRAVGALNMTDESGEDTKIIALPCIKCAPMYSHIKRISDITESSKRELVHFFEHYKDLEEGKWVKISGFVDKEEAEKIISDSIL
ncbi:MULTISPECIES: inorganic diphosphatase [Candidatus Ichthyocystis]|uniref:Inorganic pyrophosphatase n=1 Tax=Candidatus Ichthyocystis hellenicum TaxID=1561003 RepID=A0A0S4M2N4_9BURK|nr:MULTISPECIES: inorganic diphosphatase [Ichthyocystis]CUT17889.1 Inorganic pyrophosphatase [Candidatus Ichthyocystis hellenicum]